MARPAHHRYGAVFFRGLKSPLPSPAGIPHLPKSVSSGKSVVKAPLFLPSGFPNSTNPPLPLSRFSPSAFSQFSHLTTPHPMRKYPSSSVPPVRVLVAYAIRRFCDIVRPPGGRLKLPQSGLTTRCPKPVLQPHPAKSDLWNSQQRLDFGLWPAASLPRAPGLAPQASYLNSRYLKPSKG
jgi:hypothetical protein